MPTQWFSTSMGRDYTQASGMLSPNTWKTRYTIYYLQVIVTIPDQKQILYIYKDMRSCSSGCSADTLEIMIKTVMILNKNLMVVLVLIVLVSLQRNLY